MECWDLYDKDRNKLNKIVKRGDKLLDGEYHLVVNAWIINKKGEFLISQRAPNKTYPYMWECTGGSALSGETSLDAAVREVCEELGIIVKKETGRLIGSAVRYYPNCSEILDVWLFEDNTSIENIKIQESEVLNAMWASKEKIKKLYEDKKFEANSCFKDVLKFVNV